MVRQGRGDTPSQPRAVPERTSHTPHGSSTLPAPRMRNRAMSKGVSVTPRLGSAVARAMTMKEVQMTTVITADAAPMVLGEKRMGGIIRGQAAPRSGPVD